MSNDYIMSQPNIKQNTGDRREESKEEVKQIPQQTFRTNISDPELAKNMLERWVEAHSNNPYPKYRDRVEL